MNSKYDNLGSLAIDLKVIYTFTINLQRFSCQEIFEFSF